jgi:hypothetical protein
MHKLLVIFISTQVFASGSVVDTEGKKAYVGPSFKIWCTLSEKGKMKIGSKHNIKSGNLVLFPLNNGVGELPSLVVKDISKEVTVKELFTNIKEFCLDDLKALPKYINSQLKKWLTEQVPLISLRAYDEVLWEYYEGRFKNDQLKNSCKIRKAFNVKNSWVLSYPELNKGCLQ